MQSFSPSSKPPSIDVMITHTDATSVDFAVVTSEDTYFTIETSIDDIYDLHKNVFVPLIDDLHHAQQFKELEKTYTTHELLTMSKTTPFFTTIKRKLHLVPIPDPPRRRLLRSSNKTKEETFWKELKSYFSQIMNHYGFVLLHHTVVKTLYLSDDFIEHMTPFVLVQLHEFMLNYNTTQTKLDLVGWLEKEYESRNLDIGITEVTEEYKAKLNEVRTETWNPPQEWQNLLFLFVPGIWTGIYGSAFGYFKDALRFLKRWEIYNEIVAIDTFAGVARNAKIIEQRALELLDLPNNTKKKIMFVGHSKGGLDIMAAICMSNGKLNSKNVHGCICLQSPYSGSVEIDTLWLPGRDIPGISALNDLTYRKRQKFIRQYPFDARDYQIPVFCLATTMRNPKGWLGFSVKRLLAKTQQHSDGLVLVVDTLIPGSQRAVLDGIDHASTAFASKYINVPEEYQVQNAALFVAAGMYFLSL